MLMKLQCILICHPISVDNRCNIIIKTLGNEKISTTNVEGIDRQHKTTCETHSENYAQQTVASKTN
jgi:hypothetical protein